MAKGEFTCRNCKNVTAANNWRDNRKYKCPKHKDLCGNCVTSRGFINTRYECNKCNSKVTVYEYHEKYSKWMKSTYE